MSSLYNAHHEQINTKRLCAPTQNLGLKVYGYSARTGTEEQLSLKEHKRKTSHLHRLKSRITITYFGLIATRVIRCPL